ncbi:hypothetical protein BH24GEM3_BH24GEM3_12010 [soil metagenome]|jgi:hypothetical protein
MRIIFWLLGPVLKLFGSAALLLYFLSRWFGDRDDTIPNPPPRKKWLTCGRGSGKKSPPTTIGSDGGRIELNGHVLEVPRGALAQGATAKFTLHELPTPQVAVIVTAQGKFKGKLSLTMSWARCGPKVNPSKPSIYRADSATNLQDLGGVVTDRAIRTDEVDHLSKFIIAEGRQI